MGTEQITSEEQIRQFSESLFCEMVSSGGVSLTCRVSKREGASHIPRYEITLALHCGDVQLVSLCGYIGFTMQETCALFYELHDKDLRRYWIHESAWKDLSPRVRWIVRHALQRVPLLQGRLVEPNHGSSSLKEEAFQALVRGLVAAYVSTTTLLEDKEDPHFTVARCVRCAGEVEGLGRCVISSSHNIPNPESFMTEMFVCRSGCTWNDGGTPYNFYIHPDNGLAYPFSSSYEAHGV